MSEKNSLQYAIHNGDTFVPCGQTTLKLEPGFYDVVAVGPGAWGLKTKQAVSDDLIDIPGTIADEIFGDIDKFLGSKEQYQSYGLTHKRGYLFYGPPGSGKTSLGLMIAKRFVEKVGGIVMFAGDMNQFYNGVAIMREVEAGRPSLYLIEEADAIINNTHCLSILDGELSIQGAVFVAMTNYKNKLPPRIANRPGRFDRVEKVDSPPAAVQIEYLRRVEARVGNDPTAPQRIVEALEGLPLSLAHLREAFISHVLMGLELPALRQRFTRMAGLEGNEIGKAVAEIPNELNQGEEPDDSDEDVFDEWEREDQSFWEPDSPMK